MVLIEYTDKALFTCLKVKIMTRHKPAKTIPWNLYIIFVLRRARGWIAKFRFSIARAWIWLSFQCIEKTCSYGAFEHKMHAICIIWIITCTIVKIFLFSVIFIAIMTLLRPNNRQDWTILLHVISIFIESHSSKLHHFSTSGTYY